MSDHKLDFYLFSPNKTGPKKKEEGKEETVSVGWP